MTQYKEVSEEHWHIPEYIHPLLHDGGIVYLNSRSGRWGRTSRRYGAVLLKAAKVPLASLQLNWPELSRSHPQAAGIRASFVAAQLLVAGCGPNTPFLQTAGSNIEALDAGSMPAARSLPSLKPVRPGLEKLADQCLERAVHLIHREPFPVLVENLKEARGPDSETALLPQALEIASAVRDRSDWYLGKFDCFEHSVATALLAARLGLSVSVQLGASVDPIQQHAWPVVGGHHVALPDDISIMGRYHPVFAI